MKSQGTLRYSPKLLGDKPSAKWWLVLDCDENIGNLYRCLFHLDTHRVHRLNRPAWETHITVVRDEEPPDHAKHLWERYAGLRVEYEYVGPVESDGNYFWLPVQCPQLLDIRTELGLNRDPIYPLHLSVGHKEICHDAATVC